LLKLLFRLVAALVGLALLATVTGFLIPVGHEASVSARFSARPAVLFGILTDVEAYPEWRSDIDRVEVLSEPGAPLRFREVGRQGPITFQVEDSAEPIRLRVRIDDDTLPFGGSWTYVLRPFEGGTSVTITERGEIYNPLFRLLAAVAFSKTATMERFLNDLRSAEALRTPS
jgi:hypothetical protein